MPGPSASYSSNGASVEDFGIALPEKEPGHRRQYGHGLALVRHDSVAVSRVAAKAKYMAAELEQRTSVVVTSMAFLAAYVAFPSIWSQRVCLATSLRYALTSNVQYPAGVFWATPRLQKVDDRLERGD